MRTSAAVTGAQRDPGRLRRARGGLRRRRRGARLGAAAAGPAPARHSNPSCRRLVDALRRCRWCSCSPGSCSTRCSAAPTSAPASGSCSPARGEHGERIREHAHHSMGPVWEANHVWLIFVLTVFWTAYPSAFGSIASTLAVPLFIAAIGIVFRGAAYALRAGARERARVGADRHALLDLLDPHPVRARRGDRRDRDEPRPRRRRHAGHLFSSWLNPTSILIGVLAVARRAYLAAVYLAADAVRHGGGQLEGAFRTRALIAGVVAGALAVAGLIVLSSDYPHSVPLAHERRRARRGDRLGRRRDRDARARLPPPLRGRALHAPPSRSPRSSPAGRSRGGRRSSPASRSTRPRPATTRSSGSRSRCSPAGRSCSRRSRCCSA